jgi:hypothetical protein
MRCRCLLLRIHLPDPRGTSTIDRLAVQRWGQVVRRPLSLLRRREDRRPFAHFLVQVLPDNSFCSFCTGILFHHGFMMISCSNIEIGWVWWIVSKSGSCSSLTETCRLAINGHCTHDRYGTSLAGLQSFHHAVHVGEGNSAFEGRIGSSALEFFRDSSQEAQRCSHRG